jgi:hypothetical protein
MEQNNPNLRNSFLSVPKKPGNFSKSVNAISVLIFWWFLLMLLSDPYRSGEAAMTDILFIGIIFLATIFVFVELIHYLFNLKMLQIADKIFFLINSITLIIALILILQITSIIHINMSYFDFLCGDASCHWRNAVEKNNLDMCSDEKSDQYKATCYYQYAYHSKDLEPCFRMRELNDPRFNSRYNQCVNTVAIINHNIKFCDKADNSVPPETNTPGISTPTQECIISVNNTKSTDYSRNFKK